MKHECEVGPETTGRESTYSLSRKQMGSDEELNRERVYGLAMQLFEEKRTTSTVSECSACEVQRCYVYCPTVYCVR